MNEQMKINQLVTTLCQ